MTNIEKLAEKLKESYSERPRTYYLDVAMVNICYIVFALSHNHHSVYPSANPLILSHFPFVSKQVANMSTLQILSLANAEC